MATRNNLWVFLCQQLQTRSYKLLRISSPETACHSWFPFHTSLWWMLMESFACLCLCVWKSAFELLATGSFVMGLTRSWWEIPRAHWGRLKGERSLHGGGPFTWWHSETDPARSPCRRSHLCVWTLPSLFSYSTKPTQGCGDSAACVAGNQLVWLQGLVCESL